MKIFIIIMVSIIAILIVALFVLSLAFLGYIARREQFKIFRKLMASLSQKVDGDEKYISFFEEAQRREKWLKEQNLEKVSLKSRDGLKLVGHIFEAKEKTKIVVLACHGCRSSGVGEFAFHSSFYHTRGITMLLVDNRACGESEGKYMGFGGFEAKDNLLWLKFIVERYGKDVKIILHGISMGAATVLIMSKMELPKNVRGIIAESSYTSAFEEFKYQMKSAFGLKPFPLLYSLNLVGILFAKYSFKKTSPKDAVKKSITPIAFMHGGNDNFVPIEMGKELFGCTKCEKEWHQIEGCIHARCYQTKPEECEEIFDNFIRKTCEGEKL